MPIRPSMTPHPCKNPICSAQYCSHRCMTKDKTDHCHDWLCGKVSSFEDSLAYVQVPRCNTGLAAKKPFNRGELILVERPAVKRSGKWDHVPKSIKSRVMELEPRPTGTLEDKFAINGVNDCIFINFSWVNHSCLPNADFNHHKEHDILIMTAVDDIAVGDEITVNYLPKFVKHRRQVLQDRWYFRCQCRACTNPQIDQAIHQCTVIDGLIEQLVVCIEHAAESAPSIKQEDRVIQLYNRKLDIFRMLRVSPLQFYITYNQMKYITSDMRLIRQYDFLANSVMGTITYRMMNPST